MNCTAHKILPGDLPVLLRLLKAVILLCERIFALQRWVLYLQEALHN